MTALSNRPDIPEILPAKHARPRRLRAFVDGLRHVDRPWSVGIDLLVLIGFTAALCWEVWEFAQDGEWEHTAIACVALVGGTVYAFRAFTGPTRSENDR